MFINLGSVVDKKFTKHLSERKYKVCIHFWMTLSKINRNMEISIMSNDDIDPN